MKTRNDHKGKTMLNKGIIGRKELIVTEDNTAKAVGSGGLEVFATPALIALAEKTAFQSVAEHLEEEQSTALYEFFYVVYGMPKIRVRRLVDPLVRGQKPLGMDADLGDTLCVFGCVIDAECRGE